MRGTGTGTRGMDVPSDLLKAPGGKYPAKEHAAKVLDLLRMDGKVHSYLSIPFLYLVSQKTRMIEDNDEAMPFRQRRHFFYLSGVPLPDSTLIYNCRTSHLILFIPPIDPSSVIWAGLPPSPDELKARYDIDEVLYSDKLPSYLNSLCQELPLYAIGSPTIPIHNIFHSPGRDLLSLKLAIETCRVTKSAHEIALIRHANAISTIAHTAVLRAVQTARNERDLEAIFLATCITHGAREQAYHSIVAAGTNAATLHYQKNNEPLAGRLNLLLDAGAEYDCYASDITRTFPISGRFTTESRAIYGIVLRMQQACLEMLKGGCSWEAVHVRAHEVAIQGLLELGILRDAGGGLEEILAKRVSVAFFPHGLGHYLGMDTHDTGGNPDYDDADPMFRYLRIRGTVPAGSVVTVEPGIYFCRFIIQPYLEGTTTGRYIDEVVLNRYWDVGGVRIEDNILITDSGYENLTTAIKDVDEMERIINGE